MFAVKYQIRKCFYLSRKKCCQYFGLDGLTTFYVLLPIYSDRQGSVNNIGLAYPYPNMTLGNIIHVQLPVT